MPRPIAVIRFDAMTLSRSMIFTAIAFACICACGSFGADSADDDEPKTPDDGGAAPLGEEGSTPGTDAAPRAEDAGDNGGDDAGVYRWDFEGVEKNDATCGGWKVSPSGLANLSIVGGGKDSAQTCKLCLERGAKGKFVLIPPVEPGKYDVSVSVRWAEGGQLQVNDAPFTSPGIGWKTFSTPGTNTPLNVSFELKLPQVRACVAIDDVTLTKVP